MNELEDHRSWGFRFVGPITLETMLPTSRIILDLRVA